VIADFNVVRLGAFQHFSQANSYPANSSWARVPDELQDDLPANFGFRYANVDYRWRRWATAAGIRRRAKDPGLIGLELRSSDQLLLREIRGRFGGTSFGSGNRVTLVID
jgi:hypothetical protein